MALKLFSTSPAPTVFKEPLLLHCPKVRALTTGPGKVRIAAWISSAVGKGGAAELGGAVHV